MTHVADEPGRPDADGPGLLDRLWQEWTGDDGHGADVREIMVSEIAEQGAVGAATDAAWDTFHAGTELNWG